MNNDKTNETPDREYYFGYGSNIHPCRLKAENRAPSACFIGVARLAGYILKFNKESSDGSGKGNIETGLASDSVYGAVYAMTVDDKERLRDTEKGYEEVQKEILVRGVKYNCFTFEAEEENRIDNLQPYHWYKELIVLGAEYAKFPTDYIDAIKAGCFKSDLCDSRRKKQENLIEKIRKFNSAQVGMMTLNNSAPSL